MSDNFQNWVERLARDPNSSRPLSAGETVKSSAGEPFGAVEFVTISKTHFKAEVGKRGDVYIYHFYPSGTHADFEDKMGDAFNQVFKFNYPEQLEAAWTDELKSWAVRVKGWGNTVWGDDLAIRAIDVLDDLLKG